MVYAKGRHVLILCRSLCDMQSLQVVDERRRRFDNSADMEDEWFIMAHLKTDGRNYQHWCGHDVVSADDMQWSPDDMLHLLPCIFSLRGCPN